MKKRVFVTNTITLTSVSIAAKFIGIFFRGYMCTKVGPEGIGLYSLICSFYSFLASIPASGLSFSITRLVSNYEAKDKPEKARFSFLFCLFASLILGIICLFLMFYFSPFIANNIFCDKRGEIPLKILSFGIPFLATSACFRGYFFAKRHISKIACEQIVEQLLEMLIFIILIVNVHKNDVEGSCICIVIGTIVAEAFSCFQSYFMYSFSSFKKSSKKFDKKKILKKIFNLSFTVTTNSCLKNGLSSTEDVLIPVKLSCFQKNFNTALSDYGTINAMTIPIIMFPSVLISAFSNLLISEISSANAIKKQSEIDKISNKILKFTVKFSIFFCIFFWFFSKEISTFVYGSCICSIYIFTLAPIVPLVYISGIIESILKGMGKQTFCLVLNIILSFIKILLIVFLLPKIGIKGLILIIFISQSAEILTLYNQLLKNIKTKIDIKKNLYFIFIVLISCFCSKFLVEELWFLNIPLKTIISLLISSFVCLVLKNLKVSTFFSFLIPKNKNDKI